MVKGLTGERLRLRAVVGVALGLAALAAQADDSAVPLLSFTYAEPADQNRAYSDEAAGLDAALLIAKSNVQKIVQSDDRNPVEHSRALSSLAVVQRTAGETVAAIQNLESAVSVLQSEDRLHPELSRPLWELARTHAESGDYRQSTWFFDRAAHTIRVNDGLFSLGLQELMSELSGVCVAHGDYDCAERAQQVNLGIVEKHFPGDDLRKLPVMYERAAVLELAGKHLDATEKYRRIIGLVDRVEGHNSTKALPALHAIADIFLFNSIVDGIDGSEQARRYLLKAMHVTEKAPDATPLQKADALIAFADYLSLKTDRWHATVRRYREAWQLLTDAGLIAEREARFARPSPINDVPGNTTSAFRYLVNSRARDDGLEGLVKLSFDLSDRGKVRNVQVVETNPRGYGDPVVKHHLEELLFRPSFDGGEPIATVGHEYRLPFRYGPDDRLPSGATASLAIDTSASVRTP